MKKLKKIVCIIMCLCLTATGISFGANDTYAASKKYSYKTLGEISKLKSTYTLTVDDTYKYAIIKGDTDAIKKINSTLKPASYEHSEVYEMAQLSVDSLTYDDTYTDNKVQRVKYMSDDVLSVQESRIWYAGGVSNVFVYGYNFDIKTGELVTDITRFTKQKDLKKIKKTLKKKILADESGYDPSELDDMGKDDFQFYLNSKGNVVVCFGPYTLGFGGWTKPFVLKGDVN